MGNFIDLSGKKFGRLTAVRRVHDYISPKGKPMIQWLCLCDCGNEIIVLGNSLKKGNTHSCGCLLKETAREKCIKQNTTHGMSYSRLHIIWSGMKQRCYNPKHEAYHNYGGRGIAICEEWLHGFEAFYNWAIQHGYSDDLTIDRINTNGNYEPSNCRWATWIEQQNNKRPRSCRRKVG